MIPKEKYYIPQPGDLIKFKKEMEIFPTYEGALELASRNCLHYNLVNSDYKRLPEQTILTLVHFFKNPKYIQYRANQKISHNTIPYFKGCVAYVFHNNKIWSTSIFETMDDFYDKIDLLSSS